MLTQQLLKEMFSYNPETGELIRAKNAGIAKIGDTAGWKENNGYIRIRIHGKARLAHRLIWIIEYGEDPVGQVDHINHNRSDNRISNLRLVTQSGNQRNATMRKNNKSGVMGVWKRSSSRRWIVQIRCFGKQKDIGSFAEKWDAICARKSAEAEYGYHINHGMRAT